MIFIATPHAPDGKTLVSELVGRKTKRNISLRKHTVTMTSTDIGVQNMP